jgi:hypothetical protein
MNNHKHVISMYISTMLMIGVFNYFNISSALNADDQDNQSNVQERHHYDSYSYYRKCMFLNALLEKESEMEMIRRDSEMKLGVSKNIIDLCTALGIKRNTEDGVVGRMLLNQGRIDEFNNHRMNAFRERNFILTDYEENYEYYGEVLQANGKLRKAYEVFESLRNLTSNNISGNDDFNPLYLAYKAEIETELGLFATARRNFNLCEADAEVCLQLCRNAYHKNITENDLLFNFKIEKKTILGRALLAYYQGDYKSSKNIVKLYEQKYNKIVRNHTFTHGKLYLIKGWLSFRSHDFASAEKHFKTALSDFQKYDTGSIRHPNSCLAMDGLAAIEFSRKNLDKAEMIYKETLKNRKKCFGSIHHDLAVSLLGLTKVAMQKKKYDDASSYLDRSQKILDSVYDGEHPEFATVYELKAQLADINSDEINADSYKAKSASIRKKYDFNEYTIIHIVLPLEGVGEIGENDTNLDR